MSQVHNVTHVPVHSPLPCLYLNVKDTNSRTAPLSPKRAVAFVLRFLSGREPGGVQRQSLKLPYAGWLPHERKCPFRSVQWHEQQQPQPLNGRQGVRGSRSLHTETDLRVKGRRLLYIGQNFVDRYRETKAAKCLHQPSLRPVQESLSFSIYPPVRYLLSAVRQTVLKTRPAFSIS
jgi:hypothetical protein